MTVSYLCGFDMGHLIEGFSVTNTPTVQNTTTHSGVGYALRCNPSSSSQSMVFTSRQAGGANRSLFRSASFYLRVGTLPGAICNIMQCGTATGGTLGLAINSTGTLSVRGVGAATTRATSSLTITADGLWHLVEFDCGWSSGSGMRVWVDGVLFVSDTTDTSVATTTSATIGAITASTTCDLYFDDVVFDDSTLGASLTTTSSSYQLGLLQPCFDVADGNWRSSDNATVGSAYDEIYKVPPAGNTSIVVGVGRRVRNSVSGTSSIDMACEPYAGGLTVPVLGSAPINTGQTSPGFNTLRGPAASGGLNFRKLAASVIVPTGGISTGEVWLSLNKSGSPTSTVYVTIEADSSGNPSGTPLATSGLLNETTLTTTTLWYAFTFSPIALTAGSTYWVVLNRSTTDMTNFVGWTINNTDPSYTGNGKGLDTSNVWGAGSDPNFYVLPSSVSGWAVNAVMAISNDCQEITTGSPKAGSIQVLSNPAGSSVTLDFGLPNGTAGSTAAAAIGTMPAGWGTHESVVSTASVLLSTQPQVRGTKTAATSRIVDFDALYIYAQYLIPAVGAAARKRGLSIGIDAGFGVF